MSASFLKRSRIKTGKAFLCFGRSSPVLRLDSATRQLVGDEVGQGHGALLLELRGFPAGTCTQISRLRVGVTLSCAPNGLLRMKTIKVLILVCLPFHHPSPLGGGAGIEPACSFERQFHEVSLVCASDEKWRG